MQSIEKNELLELEILKHVERNPRLNNRMAASKLGCSVKLAHELLKKMVEKGTLHVRKHHARRWDYFLTPHGLTEKARLTFEFIHFSMHFYNEARKESSRVCRDIAESGKKNVAIVGCGDLAEIAYLGIKEWGLELKEIYGKDKKYFMGHAVKPEENISESSADAILICEYDKSQPMTKRYTPSSITNRDNMYWIF